MTRRLPRGVQVGRDVAFGPGCRFDLAPGATVVLGDDAQLGAGCVFAVRESVTVGAGARIGDEVAFVDHEPVVDDVEVPTRLQGVRAAAIVVGARAVVGPGAVLGPGAAVADDEVVLARSTVSDDRPPPAVPRPG